MKSKNRKVIFLVLLTFAAGIILGAETIKFAYRNSCPQNLCLDSASVIPITERDYFSIMHRELTRAEKSIHIAIFELKHYPEYPESKENLLVQDLVDAHNRGVEVKIVIDEFAENYSSYDYLKGIGIEIKHDSEEVTTHSKLVIIDGKTVILGSTNWSYYGLEKNHEANVLIRSKEIADYFEKYFDELWIK